MGDVALPNADPFTETTLKLLRAIVPGRSRAATVDLSAVYRQHRGFVARMTRQLGVPPRDVEDVVHDVFVLLGRKHSSLDADASIRSWLYGFTKRVVLHYHRGTARRKSRTERAAQDAETLSTGQQVAADAVVAQDEATRFVQQFADSLNDVKREVFLLAFSEGLTPNEIAAATDSNINTVYARLRTVRSEFESAARRFTGQRKGRNGGNT